MMIRNSFLVNLSTLAALLGGFFATNAQVGVNTTTPAATMDITAKNASGTTTTAEGLLIPRVDRQRAQSMTGVALSTLIYVNSIATGAQTGTAVNIDAAGYYYYDGTVWTKLNAGSGTGTNTNIYNTDGTLTGDRIVTQGSNTLAFTGTAANAFSVDGPTFSVDAANNGVGMGTAAPNTAAVLDLTATNKGLLTPRISLANTGTWGLAGTQTAGMTVYNTNAAIASSSSTNASSAGSYPPSVNGLGLYTWDGYGWVPQNSAPEVMKVPFPVYPAGATSGSGGSTATGITTLPLNAFTFNSISGATVTNATGAISLPAGTYRISAGLSARISNPGSNFKYMTLMVTNTPNGLGDVLGQHVQPTTMAGIPGNINGSTVIKIPAAGGTIYFTVFVNGLAAGDTWATSTASPQSYATIERIH
ncbi:hypothetical protein F3J23_15270 [Chryseobacterium sp. Tr-659]|uniref:hypothetical protein n=1 Tax=Chryseobacterium sp. Tr-659 TaxID=2608340 RepID=UPI001421700F|nr:hypothetical protein [Chryseobacterium sp. Tr-659]NIF06807.1 hypothetical protein [Chryseobacterium sp. Tr-659]